MIETAVKATLAGGNIQKVGVIGTTGTIKSKVDGFVKSPTSALHCILRHCSVL
jgi:glutamate racemase